MTSILLSVNWGNALIVTLVGFGLVLVLLILLVFLLMGFSWFFTRSAKQQPSVSVAGQSGSLSDFLTDDELAAVSMAVDMCFFDVHDQEDLKLTITHSDHEGDWASKYTALTQ